MASRFRRGKGSSRAKPECRSHGCIEWRALQADFGDASRRRNQASWARRACVPRADGWTSGLGYHHAARRMTDDVIGNRAQQKTRQPSPSARAEDNCSRGEFSCKLTDFLARMTGQDIHLGPDEQELALGLLNRIVSRLANSNDLVVVLLGSHVGTSMSATDQRRLFGRIHHGDQNKIMVTAYELETSGKRLQSMVGSVGAQQDRRCHKGYGSQPAGRQKLGPEGPREWVLGSDGNRPSASLR